MNKLVLLVLLSLSVSGCMGNLPRPVGGVWGGGGYYGGGYYGGGYGYNYSGPPPQPYISPDGAYCTPATQQMEATCGPSAAERRRNEYEDRPRIPMAERYWMRPQRGW